MKSLFDKSGKETKLPEYKDVNGLTSVEGTGLTVFYNEAVVILHINQTFTTLSGGNADNKKLLVLPNNIKANRSFWRMSSLVSVSWVPIDVTVYLAFASNSNDITLRTKAQQTNVKLTDVLVFPKSFFNITE